MNTLKVGSRVKISPNITGMDKWIDGVVKTVEDNPFNGIVIYAEANENKVVYFNKQKYFKLA